MPFFGFIVVLDRLLVAARLLLVIMLISLCGLFVLVVIDSWLFRAFWVWVLLNLFVAWFLANTIGFIGVGTGVWLLLFACVCWLVVGRCLWC